MAEEKNTQSLEKKVSFAKNLGHLGLTTLKFFIPYIGDKAYHKMINEVKESIDKKEFNFPRWFITGTEPIFYITKYGAFGYLIGKNLF